MGFIVARIRVNISVINQYCKLPEELITWKIRLTWAKRWKRITLFDEAQMSENFGTNVIMLLDMLVLYVVSLSARLYSINHNHKTNTIVFTIPKPSVEPTRIALAPLL